MNLKNFCRSIFFPVLKPQENFFFRPPSFVDFEIANTVFVHNSLSQEVHNTLKELCYQVPHMSSLAIGAILQKAVSLMHQDSVFLNIGLWKGFSLIAGLTHNPEVKGIGIDNFCFWGGNQELCQQNLEDFQIQNATIFEEDFVHYLTHLHKEAIGVYFYDGPHDYESQMAALQLAEPFFREGTIVIVDDINLEGPLRSIQDFLALHPNQYRILFSETTAGNQHPSLWNGLLILEKKPPSQDFRSLLASEPCWDAEADHQFNNEQPVGSRLLQNRTELIAFCEWIEEHEIHSYLEVGIWTGRLLSALERLFNFEKLAACDLGLLKKHYPMHIPPKTQMYWGDSQTPEYLDWRASLGHIDLIMLDADHSYEGIKKDFLLNTQHSFKYIAFHDVINKHPSGIGVKRFWDELQGNKITFAFPNLESDKEDSGMGIGIWWP